MRVIVSPSANGCCYGIPWNSPLAIVFPRESFAYHDQIARGLLPPGALHSLPVNEHSSAR